MARYDDDRLPDGISLDGYDADTNEYFGKHKDGSIWVSPPGTKYGTWRRISGPTRKVPEEPIRRPQTGLSRNTADRLSDIVGDDGKLLVPEQAELNKSKKSGLDKLTSAVKNGLQRVSSLKDSVKRTPSKDSKSGHPPKPEKMCYHKVYYYESCGHCASGGRYICDESKKNPKAKIPCKRTTWEDVFMGNKPGKCDECVSKIPSPPETRPATPAF
ncbi:uncharacterized protein GGS22DRAFT_191733 [Annulohypoxylon maeteangense]|uniref:uncharacterized protein n=1 Tax=Annulohypoxylon maeteangense TaxID=1927788 RepID=UPI002007F676|nr:uncharacterized protein GGS22DRAFT_191733 [Annulohypoxylon maeteangense]KAI0882004.1 hypothetical protein GGS22DRAFT_191733 [Annulohypoxylon maeteangense]